MLEQTIRENFEYIFEEDLLKEMIKVGRKQQVQKGETLIEIGAEMVFIPLITSGAVKVFRQDEEGDEYILYFIEGGDTCAMTLNCCMRGARSEIKAVAEVDTELIMIAITKMEDWLNFKSWRTFVFQSYNNRLSEMLAAIDSLAFMNMNERVLKYLRDKVIINKQEFLDITHNTISMELNTSRVVVSRILKKLELDGYIKLHRNKVQFLKL